MAYSEKYKKITADIIISARKRKGLTQADVARHLDIAQSTISRIEAEQLTPSVFLWFEIAELLEIPVESIKHGYLDKKTKSKIESGKNENGFLIRTKYSKLKCVKVRTLLPLAYYIIDTWGQETFEEILKELGVERSFFTNLDNQVNLMFINDFAQTLKKRYSVNLGTMKEISNYIKLAKSHGSLAQEYLNAGSHIELLQKYIKNTSMYQSFLDFELNEIGDGKKIELIITPTEQIKKPLKNKYKDLIPYIELLQEENLKYFSLFKYNNLTIGNDNCSIELVKKSSLIDGDKNIRYELSLVS